MVEHTFPKRAMGVRFFLHLFFFRRDSSAVEQSTENRCVEGSNPSLGNENIFLKNGQSVTQW